MKTIIILAIMALSLSIFGLMSCDEKGENSIPTSAGVKNDLSKTDKVNAISAQAQGIGHVMYLGADGDVNPLPGSEGCSASSWFCSCEQKSCPDGLYPRCVVTPLWCDCDCVSIKVGSMSIAEIVLKSFEMRKISDEEIESLKSYSNYLTVNGHDDLNTYMYKYIKASNSEKENEFYESMTNYLETFESLPEETQIEINLWIYNNNPTNN